MAEAAQQRLKLLFDLTRLRARASFATPTGIDRVDLAYAEALCSASDVDAQFIEFGTFGGPSRLDDAAARALIRQTTQKWQTEPHQASPAFASLNAWLAAPAGTLRPERKTEKPRAAWMPQANDVRRAFIGLNPFHRGSDPAALYINTSHGQLFRPAVARWLNRRDGVGGVFFVHDLIPIEHPEFNRAREPERHRSRLRLIARHARLVIVNSEATAKALTPWLAAEGLKPPAIQVIPLGVAEAFDKRRAPDDKPSPVVPYFVVLGTIEPRKNHALLLELWRTLAAASGQQAPPRLVVLGRRGWENQAVFDLLDHAPELRSCVIEAAGLSDAELARLLRGARALLAPSFAEGYGLPVTEALLAGTPVIASNIAAHREVGGVFADYLDPRDGPAWAAAIAEYARPGSLHRAQRVAALAAFRAMSWREHAEAAITAIREAAHARQT